jgi:DNA-binding beta-propeller fold protein YncE
MPVTMRRAMLRSTLGMCGVLGLAPILARPAQAQGGPTASSVGARAAEAAVPEFQVDPFWPKPLPNNWIIGAVAGVAVDKRDHIWIVQRPGTIAQRQLMAERNPPETNCCVRAPAVLVFDRQGNVLRHWGGPGQGYEWPEVEHGVYVDANDFVWLAGSGAKDHQLLKFTLDGQFVMQIGRSGQSKGNADTANLNRPADVEVDTEAREVYVADGYGNRRVIVFDSETGAYKRHWGAYGQPPVDGGPEAYGGTAAYTPGQPPSRQFASPVHCVRLTRDRQVYVCDRTNDRYQVFQRDGTFVVEHFIAPQTRLNGSVADLVPSLDPSQEFLFSVDNSNGMARVIRRRDGEVLSTFGRPGRWAGQFHVPHNIAQDSEGSLYISEVDNGQRVQRFVRRGPS